MWWLLLLCSSVYASQDIRDYLLAHPEVVAEALEKHQHNVQMVNIKTVVEDTSSQIVIANEAGEHQLLMFVDYRCGACRRVYPWVSRFIAAHPEVKLVLKQYPVLGTESIQAALMMYDVAQEDAFELNDALIDQSYSFSKERLRELAKQYHVNVYLPSMLQRHQAFPLLERSHQHSEMLGNKSVPFFILSVGDHYEKLHGIASQEELETTYQQML